MARGWESKAVEAQQEMSVRDPLAGKGGVSAAERERQSMQCTLALARARAAADLQRATTPAHRAMLEAALAALDRQLRENA
jgi:hypothetical protein